MSLNCTDYVCSICSLFPKDLHHWFGTSFWKLFGAYNASIVEKTCSRNSCGAYCQRSCHICWHFANIGNSNKPYFYAQTGHLNDRYQSWLCARVLFVGVEYFTEVCLGPRVELSGCSDCCTERYLQKLQRLGVMFKVIDSLLFLSSLQLK